MKKVRVEIREMYYLRFAALAEALKTTPERIFSLMFSRLYQMVEQTHDSYFQGIEPDALGTAWMAGANIDTHGRLTDKLYKHIVLRGVTYSQYLDFLFKPRHKHEWSWVPTGNGQKRAIYTPLGMCKRDIMMDADQYLDVVLRAQMTQELVDELLDRIIYSLLLRVELTHDDYLVKPETSGNTLVVAFNLLREGRDGKFQEPHDAVTEVNVNFRDYFFALLHISEHELEKEMRDHLLFQKSVVPFELVSNSDTQQGLRKHPGKWVPHARRSEEDLERDLDG